MALGGGHRVVELDQSARTAADAARALGCRVDQIVKSLVFRGQRTDRAVLVTVSGANRVDEAKVAELVDESVEKADAAFVRARTGFAIGGVAPIGSTRPLTTRIDEGLFTRGELCAASGPPLTASTPAPPDPPRGSGRPLCRAT